MQIHWSAPQPTAACSLQPYQNRPETDLAGVSGCVRVCSSEHTVEPTNS